MNTVSIVFVIYGKLLPWDFYFSDLKKKIILAFGTFEYLTNPNPNPSML